MASMGSLEWVRQHISDSRIALNRIFLIDGFGDSGKGVLFAVSGIRKKEFIILISGFGDSGKSVVFHSFGDSGKGHNGSGIMVRVDRIFLV